MKTNTNKTKIIQANNQIQSTKIGKMKLLIKI